MTYFGKDIIQGACLVDGATGTTDFPFGFRTGKISAVNHIGPGVYTVELIQPLSQFENQIKLQLQAGITGNANAQVAWTSPILLTVSTFVGPAATDLTFKLAIIRLDGVVDASAYAGGGGGGGAVPGGVSGSLQFNNAGVFGGLTEAVTTDGDKITLLESMNDPALPVAPGIVLFNNPIAGNGLPSYQNAYSPITPLQAALFGKNASYWIPGTSAMAQVGPTLATTGGSFPAVVAGDIITSQRRHSLATAAAVNSAAYDYSGTQFLWRGNAAGLGGFFIHQRIALTTVNATQRLFSGLRNSGVIIGNVDPSTLTDIVGIGCDSADTELQFMHNDAAGAAVKLALGPNFPKSDGTVYDVYLYAPPNGAEIFFQVNRIDVAHTTQAGALLDIPAATAILAPTALWTNNAATAVAARVELMRWYAHTDN